MRITLRNRIRKKNKIIFFTLKPNMTIGIKNK